MHGHACSYIIHNIIGAGPLPIATSTIPYNTCVTKAVAPSYSIASSPSLSLSLPFPKFVKLLHMKGIRSEWIRNFVADHWTRLRLPEYSINHVGEA